MRKEDDISKRRLSIILPPVASIKLPEGSVEKDELKIIVLESDQILLQKIEVLGALNGIIEGVRKLQELILGDGQIEPETKEKEASKKPEISKKSDPKVQIQIDKARLDELKEKYGKAENIQMSALVDSPAALVRFQQENKDKVGDVKEVTRGRMRGYYFKGNYDFYLKLLQKLNYLGINLPSEPGGPRKKKDI